MNLMNSIDHYNDAPRVTESTIVNEGGYVHEHPLKKLTIELNTISSESRVITHGKSYVFTKDLGYFAKLKKTFKIWKYDLEVIEVATRKKFWLCTHCETLYHLTCPES